MYNQTETDYLIRVSIITDAVIILHLSYTQWVLIVPNDVFITVSSTLITRSDQCANQPYQAPVLESPSGNVAEQHAVCLHWVQFRLSGTVYRCLTPLLI